LAQAWFSPCATSRFAYASAIGASLLFSAAARLKAGRRNGYDARHPLLNVVFFGALFAFLFVFLTACAVKMRQTGLTDLVGPFSVNTIEGREAVKAWLMRQGQDIYSPLTGYPFLITLYPPFYYAVAAGMTLVAGPGLLAAKLASLAERGLMLAMLGALARRATGSFVAAVAAPAIFFLTPEATCGFLCKPDTLAFGLVLTAGFFFEGAANGGPGAGRALGPPSAWRWPPSPNSRPGPWPSVLRPTAWPCPDCAAGCRASCSGPPWPWPCWPGDFPCTPARSFSCKRWSFPGA
jgi:hypothetical protein